MSKVTIAIISDLHCHGLNDLNRKKESFLVAGDTRTHIERHPVESLLVLQKSRKIKADVLLCPGDLANKVSQEGLSYAWDTLRGDIKLALKAKSVLCTIGNHDVVSRKAKGSPFQMAQQIHPQFPFAKDEDKNQFWHHGFCLQTIGRVADFLIINTTHDHYETESARRGTFRSDMIVELDKYLKSKAQSPIRLAVLHHHPILHSFVNYDSKDVLPTGDQLLDILSRHRFSLVVHGHRHQARIKRFSANGQDYHIFCAGSFSAYLKELGSRTRNLFHLIEIETVPGTVSQTTGKIETWEFNLGRGWNPSTLRSAEFPHLVKIGSIIPIGGLLSKIKQHFNTQKNIQYLSIDKLKTLFPSLDNFLPDELEYLQKELLGDALKAEIDQFGSLVGIGKIRHIITNQ